MRFSLRLPRAAWLASSLMGVVSLAAAPALAQDPAARAQAVQLFDAADKLMHDGQISAACPKYAASMKLDPQLGALLHLADCYAKNGQVASAWGSFREAEEMARMKNDDRASYAKDQAAQLEPRLSHLTVLVPDSANLQGLEVRVDGSVVTSGAWSLPSPIDHGSHRVEARAPGRQTWSTSVNVTGDAQEARVEIPVLGETAAAPAAAPHREGGGPVEVRLDDSGSAIRTLGWVGIGVGAASAGLGVVFWAQRNSKLDQRNNVCPTRINCSDAENGQLSSLTSDARSAQSIETVGFAVGGALVIGGILAVVLAPSPRAHAESAWLVPSLSPKLLGFAGGTTW